MNLDKEFYKQIFESDVMADYLSQTDIKPEYIREAVLLAPVSLTKKREIIKDLSTVSERYDFEKDLALLNTAINEMNLKKGEMFLLFEQIRGESIDFAAPCASTEDLWERIKNSTKMCAEFDDEESEEPLVSYTAEKWSSNGKNFKKTAEYIIADGEVYGFKHLEFDSRQPRVPMFGESADISLPMPFTPGDIVLIDCTPFAPPQRAVILDTGKNPYDRRFPCVLFYHNDKRVWKTGALKHKHIFTDSVFLPLSPLYKIDYAPKPVADEPVKVSKRLNAVSEYIRGREEKVRKLFNHIFNYKCDETGARKGGITKEKLLDFLNEVS